MRISTRLSLGALVPVVLALVAIAGVLLSYYSVAELRREQSLIIQTRTDLSELNEFARSYLLYHEERSRRQFIAKADEALERLDRTSSPDPEHQQSIRRISDDLREMRTLFLRTVTASETGGSVSAEAEERLAGQLFIRSADANGTAAGLVRTITGDMVTRQQRLALSVSLLTILAAVMLTAGLLMLRHGIIRSLRLLAAGTDALSAGRLEHRIDLPSADELGDLGRSFDRMAGRLQDVTVSRDELERELARTTALKEVARAAATLDPIELGERVLETLDRVLDTRSAVLYLVDERAGLLKKLAIRGYARDVAPLFDEIPVDDQSVSGRSVLADSVLRFTYEQLPPLTRMRADAANEEAMQWLVVPIHSSGVTIGNFTLVFDATRPIGDDDVALLLSIGDQLGVAIENARLHERTTDELQRTALLEEVAEAAGSGVELDRVARRVLEAIRGRIGLQDGQLYALTADGAALTQLAAIKPRGRTTGAPERIPLHETERAMVRAFLEETVLIGGSDAGSEPDFPSSSQVDGADKMRCISLPLKYRGRVLGVLSMTFPDRHPFRAQELEVFEAVAGISAQAVANALAYEAEREAGRYSDALNRVNAAVNSTLEFDDIMHRVMTETSGALDADSAVISVREGERWVARYVLGLDEHYVGRVFANEEVNYSELSAAEGHAVIIDDPIHDERADEEIVRRYGIAAILDIALRVGDKVIGDFALHYRTPDKRFTPAQAAFVEKVAASATLALRNAKLYEGERSVADRLQEALLTLPESVSGIDFAHAYHAASEAARVGGDFYDVFEMENDLLGITIGDIAGKGLGAAVLTSLVKNAIRAHANEKGATPAKILELTNDVAYKGTPSETFVTVFFGVLDRGTGSLVCASAGHTTAAIIGADGAVRALPPTGPILGAFEHVPYEQFEEQLDVAETLFMYTDGLTEARRDRELFGEARVFGALSRMQGGGPSSAVRAMIAEVLAFTGGGLNDDLALLAVRRQGSERRTSSHRFQI